MVRNGIYNDETLSHDRELFNPWPKSLPFHDYQNLILHLSLIITQYITII